MLRMYEVTITDGERPACLYLVGENLTEIMVRFKGTKATSITIEDVTEEHIFITGQLLDALQVSENLTLSEIIWIIEALKKCGLVKKEV